jgi:REP element-mobilizing transposase RayT
MVRQVRIEFEDATYHVMCRGDRQEPIFRNSRDHEIFLDTLGEVVERMGWRLHAFVLMGNHYHLLIETPKANLVDGMHWFQGTYTQRFNARHKVGGHLFQGRYKALLIDRDGDYFSTVLNYIHLNPARAFLNSPFSKNPDAMDSWKLSDYTWSSHLRYLRPAKRPEWFCVERGFYSLGFEDSASGRTRYRNYMNKRVRGVFFKSLPEGTEESWKKIRRGWVLGSSAFREEMQVSAEKVMKGKHSSSYSGDARRSHDQQRATEIFITGLGLFDLREEELLDLKKGDHRKKVIAWMIRKRTSVRNEWIAERLRMGHPNSISRNITEVERVTKGELFKLKKEMLECED